MSARFKEVSQMFNNNVMQSDMNEAMDMVRQMFYDKYLKKLQNALTEQQTEIVSAPTKEIKLMQAVKQFMPAHKQEDMEKMIDMMVLTEMFKSFQGEIQENKPKISVQSDSGVKSVQEDTDYDSSVHKDGIYDIDYNCLKSSDAPINEETAWNKLFSFCVMYLGLLNSSRFFK